MFPMIFGAISLIAHYLPSPKGGLGRKLDFCFGSVVRIHFIKGVSANERNHMKNFDRLNFDESFVIIVTRHSNLFQSLLF
jgi:hypothetical protein